MATKRNRTTGDPIEAADGSLVLMDEAGAPVQLVPPNMCEAVRTMTARMRLNDGVDVPPRLGVISALAGEGVTTLTRALGLVLSNDLGRRTCLVELNWWSPSPWTEGEYVGGVAEVIAAGASLDSVILTTGNPGLSILPAGATAVSERPLLANSAELDRLLTQVSERFDHVLLDLPAIGATSDALALAERADSLVLVVRHGATTESDVKKALDQLVGLNVVGAIMNRYSSSLPGFVKRRLPVG